MFTAYHPDLSLGDDAFISLKKASQLNAAVGGFLELLPVEPCSQALAEEVHFHSYVRLVFAGEVSGFPEASARVTHQIRMAVGAMVAAVRAAVMKREIVCAPVSGFHHAGLSSGGGYCTLNGLMLAIADLRNRAWDYDSEPILILDGDAHFGNGTAEILRFYQDKGGFRNVTHLTRGVDYDAANWYRMFRAALEMTPWALVLYQAGADAHIDDRYGAGYLSDDDWKERDHLVFETCAARRIPCAWNLAGGYNDEGGQTIDLHRRTWFTAAHINAQLRRAGTPAPAPTPPSGPTEGPRSGAPC